MLTCCVRPLGNVLLLLMLFFLGQSAVEAGMYVTIYDEEQVAVFGVKNAAGEELIFDDIPDSLSIMHQATWTILDHSGGNASTTSSVDDVFYNNGPPFEMWNPVRLVPGDLFSRTYRGSSEQATDNIPEDGAYLKLDTMQLFTISNLSEQNLSVELELTTYTTFAFSLDTWTNRDVGQGAVRYDWIWTLTEGHIFEELRIQAVSHGFEPSLFEISTNRLLSIDIASGETVELLIDSWVGSGYVYATPEPSTIHLATFISAALLLAARRKQKTGLTRCQCRSSHHA